MTVVPGLKALLFDVQGTLVDFYSTIVTRGEALTRARGVEADWSRLIRDWRADYRRCLDQVIAREIPWRSTDAIYREALDRLLAAHDWGGVLSVADRDALNRLWRELEPWPDARPGLTRLAEKFTIATLSNGSMASVVGIVKRARLPFDCVLTAELVRSSKPDPKVYALATSALGFEASEVMMVACHKYDLAAAKVLGFRVGFIPRPLEFGPYGSVDVAPETYFDLIARDVEDLADKLAP